MYPARVDSRKFIESLYEEFGRPSPFKLTIKVSKTLNHKRSIKKKVKKKSVFKDTKKQRKVKRK